MDLRWLGYILPTGIVFKIAKSGCLMWDIWKYDYDTFHREQLNDGVECRCVTIGGNSSCMLLYPSVEDIQSEIEELEGKLAKARRKL